MIPGQSVCNGSQIILNPLVSGGIPPFVYSWSSTGDALSCNNCANPSVTITQNSTYILTVKDANNTLAYDTVTYTVNGTTTTIQSSLTNTNISCSDPTDTTTAVIANGIIPVTFLFGAMELRVLEQLRQRILMRSQVFTYLLPAIPLVVLHRFSILFRILRLLYHLPAQCLRFVFMTVPAQLKFLLPAELHHILFIGIMG